MSKQHPPTPTARSVGPYPTLIEISRTSWHWKFGLNNILFINKYIHVYIQTIQLTIGSDGKHSAYMKVIS